MPFPSWYRSWLNFNLGIAGAAATGATTPPRETPAPLNKRATPSRNRRHTLLVAYCVEEIQHDLDELSVEELISLMGGD